VAAVAELVRARSETRVVAVAQLGGGVRDQRNVGQVDTLAGVQHEFEREPIARLGVGTRGDPGAPLPRLAAGADPHAFVAGERLLGTMRELAGMPVGRGRRVLARLRGRGGGARAAHRVSLRLGLGVQLERGA
jgi:hypothetical protein